MKPEQPRNRKQIIMIAPRVLPLLLILQCALRSSGTLPSPAEARIPVNGQLWVLG